MKARFSVVIIGITIIACTGVNTPQNPIVPPPPVFQPPPVQFVQPEPPKPVPVGPEEQIRFVQVVESFFQPYRSASNELKKSSLRAERRTAIANLGYPGQVKDWFGIVATMGTNSDGNASVNIKLEGSQSTAVCTFTADSLIPNGTELYNRLANMSRGTKVTFSGFLVPGNDHIVEISITERGSMLDPAFMMRFTDVRAR